MLNKFRPFKKLNVLEKKGIKKKKIIRNIISCFFLILFLIYLIITIINTVIEYNEHIKGAEKCRVLIKDNIKFSYFNPEYKGMQIVTTGEYVTVDPLLNKSIYGIADSIYPEGGEFDALCYMYNGKKNVSLHGMLLFILYKPISLTLLCIIGIAQLSFVTYRRIKTVNSPDRKEITNEKRSKIERCLFSIVIIFLFISFAFPKIILTFAYNLFVYILSLIFSAIYTVTDNYYIDLIPPGSTNVENPSS